MHTGCFVDLRANFVNTTCKEKFTYDLLYSHSIDFLYSRGIDITCFICKFPRRLFFNIFEKDEKLSEVFEDLY